MFENEHWCEHPQLVRKDPVTADYYPLDAVAQRRDGRCGPDGKFWEPIPPMPKFLQKRSWWRWNPLQAFRRWRNR